MKVELYKAQGIGGELVDDLKITATKEVPDIHQFKEDDYKFFYMNQAKSLYEALKLLPRGTRDHLFALMVQDKASLYCIR